MTALSRGRAIAPPEPQPPTPGEKLQAHFTAAWRRFPEHAIEEAKLRWADAGRLSMEREDRRDTSDLVIVYTHVAPGAPGEAQRVKGSKARNIFIQLDRNNGRRVWLATFRLPPGCKLKKSIERINEGDLSPLEGLEPAFAMIIDLP